MSDYFKRRYFNYPSAGSFAGLSGFIKNKKLSTKKPAEFSLKELKTFNLHSPARVKFQRNPVICPKINYLWSSDIIIYDKYFRQNQGYRYCIIFVDCLSKMLYSAPMKRKNSESVSQALENIIKKSKKKPELLWTDDDGAYNGSATKTVLKKHKIKLYHVKTHLKASLAERYVRRLKTLIAKIFTKNGNHKWVDFLSDITKNINSSFNRSIQMAPNEVSKNNESTVWYNLYKKYIGIAKEKLHLKVGDFVKISKNKLVPFRKGYDAQWSSETFIVDSINSKGPVPFMKLKDKDGEGIEGTYYQKDLLKVSNLENSD